MEKGVGGRREVHPPRGTHTSQEGTEAAQAHRRSRKVRLKSQDTISLTVQTGKGKD